MLRRAHNIYEASLANVLDMVATVSESTVCVYSCWTALDMYVMPPTSVS